MVYHYDDAVIFLLPRLSLLRSGQGPAGSTAGRRIREGFVSSRKYKSRLCNDPAGIIMKKITTNSTANHASVFAVAALVFLLLVAGCTSQPAAVPLTTPPVTTVKTTATTMTVLPTATGELPNTTADRVFAEAADACYRNTPVISNISSHLAFATCMKDTPLPAGNCAQNFRYYVLKSTNEDPTTAGFAREMATARMAREAFLRGEGYDGIRQEYAPCGNATQIPRSFYQ